MISPVHATQPLNGGRPPGMAPTNTATGPTHFNGVYAKPYKTNERNDK